MSSLRIALACLPFPESPDASVTAAVAAIAEASAAGAGLVCFPECFVPGYRALGAPVPVMPAEWLATAHTTIADAARASGVAVVLGTERYVGDALRITALVIDPDGEQLGWQDKVQLDPSEDHLYEPAPSGREVFRIGDLVLGVVICHEGFRYPETVREAVAKGAQLVVFPHYSEPLPGHFQPTHYGDPRLSFHESAVMGRAAENTCWVAGVNCAVAEAPTSAIARPDGSLLAWRPHGEPGILVADLDLSEATHRMAKRFRPSA
ncbi:MAG TPA: carbon-nitrogen hydrolase family protein [Propionicimonas sp.]|nr:carbon-nitrogen hydrolase family protein [Propionicimonas sp.]HQA77052.1 carbon-nitrogen hydrolase family protein [Propionicimonas sp.]HQD96182.1 carbon-nitrogen hydrolase family protein [Propionicimonas sp.]